MTVTLIREGVDAGARCYKALHISVRTLQRWAEEDGLEDKRKLVKRTPANKLTFDARERILAASIVAMFFSSLHRSEHPSRRQCFKAADILTG